MNYYSLKNNDYNLGKNVFWLKKNLIKFTDKKIIVYLPKL